MSKLCPSKLARRRSNYVQANMPTPAQPTDTRLKTYIDTKTVSYRRAANHDKQLSESVTLTNRIYCSTNYSTNYPVIYSTNERSTHYDTTILLHKLPRKPLHKLPILRTLYHGTRVPEYSYAMANYCDHKVLLKLWSILQVQSVI